MADYRIDLRVRNNNLLRAIEAAGYSPGQKLADEIGIPYSALNGYLSLKSSPINKQGEISDSAEKICAFLFKSPYQLWSDEQLTPLEKNRAHFEASASDIAAIANESFNPLDLIELRDKQVTVRKILDTLDEREKEVISMRFGIDDAAMTLDEVAEHFNLSRERIRQIEAKALRKLRSPSRANPLLTGEKYINAEQTAINAWTGVRISCCGFSEPVTKALLSDGVSTVGDLLKYTRAGLMKVRRIGARDVREICQFLEAAGLGLRKPGSNGST